jgi:hypothetical protein
MFKLITHKQLSPNHSSASHRQTLCSSPGRLNKTFTPHDHQSAFRKGHSTLDPLLAFTALEKQRQRDGLRTHTFFLDMQKAYDKVWHGLFWKLHKNMASQANCGASSMNYTQTQLAHRSSKGRQQNCTESSRALLSAAPCHLHCSTCSLMIC